MTNERLPRPSVGQFRTGWLAVCLLTACLAGCDRVYEWRGKGMFSHGDYQAAAETFARALNANSNRPALYWWYARTCERMGSNDLAASNYARAAALASSNGQYHLDHALLAHKLGRTNEAIGAYTKAIEFERNSFTALLQRARCHYGTRQFGQALLDVTYALQVSPSNGHALLVRANILRREDAFKAAMADCRLAMQINPQWAEPFRVAGRVADDADRQADALAFYTEAIARSNTFADAYYDRGCVYFGDGHYALALPDFREAALIDPKNHRAWEFYGICLYETGDPERALIVFDRVLELAPKYDECYYERAHALNKLGRYDEAISNLFICLSITSNHFAAINNLGYNYRCKGEHAAAIPWFERVLATYPSNALALYNLGCCYTRLSNYHAAVQCMDDAISASPRYYSAYEYRAYLYDFKLGSWQQAADDYMTMAALRPTDVENLRDILAKVAPASTASCFVADAILRQEPDYITGLVRRAWFHACSGNLSNAFADASAALSLDADCPSAYSARYMANLRKGDYPSALVNHEKFIQLTSNESAQTAFIHGKLFNAVGRYREAVGPLTYAIEQDSRPPFALVERALAYAAIGMYSNALADARAAPEHTHNRGWLLARCAAYAGLEMHSNVVADFRTLVRRTQSADQAKVRAVRARSYLALGMTNEANADIDFCEQYGVDPNIAITSIVHRVDRF